MSRFDAIFLIKDTRSEARDRTIAEHVMKIHINHNNMTHPDAEIDINKLKRYIAYCRARCAPRLSSEASEILTHQYVTMRARHRAKSITGGSDVPIPLTVRQLEAIVRISESLAKMTLSNTVRTALSRDPLIDTCHTGYQNARRRGHPTVHSLHGRGHQQR